MSAVRQGIRHLLAAPGLVVLVWMAGLLVALPAAVVVEEAIHGSIEHSLAREALLEGLDTGWLGEFQENARGLAATVEPSHVGVGATLDALERWWQGSIFSGRLEVVAFGIAFSLVWLLLLGGILERLRRPWDRMSLSTVLADGSRFFWRFVRITLLAAPCYYGIFRLAGWLFGRIEVWTRDVTTEWRILLWNLVAAGFIVLLLATVRLIVDYARISMVADGHHSALVAVVRGLGLVLRRPLATYGLVIGFAVVSAALVAAYAALAPGVGQGGPIAIALAIAGSQLYLLLRVGLRLGLLSSQAALFEQTTAGRL